jgi:hypothetical protein
MPGNQSTGLTIHGVYGFASEYDVERKFRESRVLTVALVSNNSVIVFRAVCFRNAEVILMTRIQKSLYPLFAREIRSCCCATQRLRSGDRNEKG